MQESHLPLVVGVVNKGKKYNWELERNWTEVKEDKDKQLKEVNKKESWYHHNLKRLIDRYVNESIKEYNELKEISIKLEEIERTIKNLNFEKL